MLVLSLAPIHIVAAVGEGERENLIVHLTLGKTALSCILSSADEGDFLT